MAEAALGEEVRALIAPLMKMIDAADKQLMGANAKLDALSEREPIIPKLKTTPGVGAVVAAAFVAVLDDPKRFKNAHQVESYLGLVPSEQTSGKRRLGAISKQGNSYVRSLLVQAAWAIWRLRDKNDPLYRWVHDVAERRGKRVAVIALARRIAGILWALWRDGTVYDARQLAKDSAHGLARQSQTVAMQAVTMKRAGRKKFGRLARIVAA